MNWNGQRETLDHLIRRRLNPGKADSLQADFDAKRISRLESDLTITTDDTPDGLL